MTSHDIGTNIGIFNQYQQYMICADNVIEILSGLNGGIVMSNEQQKQLPQISHTAHCDLNAVQLGFVCLCKKVERLLEQLQNIVFVLHEVSFPLVANGFKCGLEAHFSTLIDVLSNRCAITTKLS
jgi:hypothetical protein